MTMTTTLHLLLVALIFQSSYAWMIRDNNNVHSRRTIALNSMQGEESSTPSRRHFLNAAAVASSTLLFPSSSRAATRDICDATNPRCGPDGQLLDSIPSGEAIPRVTNRITQIVEMNFDIGREESGVIRLGLYGKDAPASVRQFLQFVTRGLKTTSELTLESSMGMESIPVSLTQGGVVGQIVPGQRIDFGVPLQSTAFARYKGRAKAGDDFLAQTRPKEINEPVFRNHDAAGLLSVPGKGIGYGGSSFESDDACFESSFQITAAPVPLMDKEGRLVIGQVLDKESMTNLARLASLPTKKGIKGVIPGKNSGPPLLKVSLRNVFVGAVDSNQK
jgi:cyclophilin family peptidyl-prolyl cis-trans isomerase